MVQLRLQTLPSLISWFDLLGSTVNLLTYRFSFCCFVNWIQLNCLGLKLDPFSLLKSLTYTCTWFAGLVCSFWSVETCIVVPSLFFAVLMYIWMLVTVCCMLFVRFDSNLLHPFLTLARQTHYNILFLSFKRALPWLSDSHSCSVFP